MVAIEHNRMQLDANDDVWFGLVGWHSQAPDEEAHIYIYIDAHTYLSPK